MAKLPTLVKAEDLIPMTIIRVYNVLGTHYEVEVRLLQSFAERDQCLIKTVKLDGTEGPTLRVHKDQQIEVISLPDMSLKGQLTALMTRWERTLQETHNDDEYVGAAELYGELEAIMKSQTE